MKRTDRRIAQLRALAPSHSAAEIARRLGVCCQSVINWAAAEGIALPARSHAMRKAWKRPSVRAGYVDRWRGRLPIPKHAHPLVRAFFVRLNAERTTLTEVAERAGLRRGTISDWRYRREPTVSNFEAALNVIGLRLVIMEDR